MRGNTLFNGPAYQTKIPFNFPAWLRFNSDRWVCASCELEKKPDWAGLFWCNRDKSTEVLKLHPVLVIAVRISESYFLRGRFVCNRTLHRIDQRVCMWTSCCRFDGLGCFQLSSVEFEHADYFRQMGRLILQRLRCCCRFFFLWSVVVVGGGLWTHKKNNEILI